METNVILKYKRNADSWICPECDSENDITATSCGVCGTVRINTVPVVKAWTPKDDMPPVSVNRPVSRTPEKKFRSAAYKAAPHKITPPVAKKSSHKVLYIFITLMIIAIIAIVSVTVVNNISDTPTRPEKSEEEVLYEEATDAMDDADYETAIEKLEQLPSDYEDVDELLKESKYNRALQLMKLEKYEEAKEIFEELDDYSASGDKLKECDYQIASKLLEDGDFDKAKEIFLSLSDYSDCSQKIKECDYQVALVLLDNEDYVEAMKAFNDLDSYRSSHSMFTEAETRLISENSSNNYFSDYDSIIGTWKDSSGNYVKYEKNSNGVTQSWYNVEASSGNYFKIENGVHYIGDDTSGWKKQWIFERVTSTNANIYDYISGETYFLTKTYN